MGILEARGVAEATEDCRELRVQRPPGHRHQYGTDNYSETVRGVFVSSNLSVPTSVLTNMMRPDMRYPVVLSHLK